MNGFPGPTWGEKLYTSLTVDSDPNFLTLAVEFMDHTKMLDRFHGWCILPSSPDLIWVVVSNIMYFHPDPWGNDPI